MTKVMNVAMIGGGFMGKAPAMAYASMPMFFWPAPAIPHRKVVVLADENGPLSWRCQKKIAGSGAVGDIGTHVVDLAQYLVGPVAEVIAMTKTYVTTRLNRSGFAGGSHF